MKRTYIIALLCLVLTNVSKGQEVWKWASGGGGSAVDYAFEIATDPSGNILMTGNFLSDTLIIGMDTLLNKGNIDVFLVKHDPDGNPLWARSFGGSDEDNGFSVATDAAGSSYVTGHFKDTLYIGADTLVSSGDNDVYLAKYDSSGNPIWGVSGGGSGADKSTGVDVDGSGNIYISGRFDGASATFGLQVLNNTSPGTDDLLVVKYDPAGNMIWAKNIGGTNHEQSHDIAADIFGNVYVTGWFFSTSIVFGSTTLNNNGFIDFYILKMDTAGNPIWAKSAGGSMEDEGFGITTDSLGDVYVTGNFHSSTITFDTITLTSNGDRDMFICKFDSAGNIAWAKNAGGALQDRGESVALDGAGNVVVAGWFAGTDMVFASDTILSNGGNDIFVAKYDASGNEIWGKSAGGASNDVGNGIAIDASDNIYVSGYQDSPSVLFGTNTVNSNGNRDFFLGRISACAIPIDLGGSAAICTGDSLIVDAGTGIGYTYLWSTGDTNQYLSVDTAGLYSVQVTDANTCVNSDTISVSVNATYYLLDSTAICQGDSILLGGAYQTSSGIYYDSLISVTSCDSVSVTTLIVNPIYNISDSAIAVCSGDSVLIYGVYRMTGSTYYDSSTTITGCDSIRSTVLTVNSAYAITTSDETICDGDSVQIFGVFRSVAGTYYDSLSTAYGCDSIRSTVLTVNSAYAISASNETICDGDSVQIFGIFHSVAGTYYDSLSTVYGCDSIIATTLVVTSLPLVNMSGLDSSYCSIDAGITMTGMPANGTFSGTGGVAGDQFFPATGVGTYIVAYTYIDSSGCSNSVSQSVSVIQCPVSIPSELESVQNIRIFPNPSTGKFIVELNNVQSGKIALRLFNGWGQEIYAQKLIQENGHFRESFDLTRYAAGVYSLQIITDLEVIKRQIIVE